MDRPGGSDFKVRGGCGRIKLDEVMAVPKLANFSSESAFEMLLSLFSGIELNRPLGF